MILSSSSFSPSSSPAYYITEYLCPADSRWHEHTTYTSHLPEAVLVARDIYSRRGVPARVVNDSDQVVFEIGC